MNAIVKAHQTMKSLIAIALNGRRPKEELVAEYMTMDVETLANMLADVQSRMPITVESVCQPIMEHKDCSWLNWNDIATAVAAAMGSDTSEKCIASYASKNTKNKGWKVAPRKSMSERQAEYMKLANLN